jgi:hypothetical protein
MSSGKRGKPWGTPELQAKIAHAIALHRREWGNKYYDLVRERAGFAEWIGKEAGEAGRRRFSRMVRLVREPLPKDRTRPHQRRDINIEQHEWAKAQANRANISAGLPIHISTEQVMAGGPTALVGFQALCDLISQGPADLLRARAAWVIADPDAPGGERALDPVMLQKNVLARADFARVVADLQRSYSSIFATTEFAKGAVRIALDAAGEDVVSKQRVTAQFADFIQNQNGIRPE